MPHNKYKINVDYLLYCFQRKKRFAGDDINITRGTILEEGGLKRNTGDGNVLCLVRRGGYTGICIYTNSTLHVRSVSFAVCKL